jgi:hypothetical protein
MMKLEWMEINDLPVWEAGFDPSTHERLHLLYQ